jgi:death-on-curing protein
MSQINWLSKIVIIAIHGELLAEHGGLDGTYKGDSLESTLARPQQLLSYGNPGPSLYDLAACYGYGFARNHCFSDGNKRIALAAIDVFLQLSGHELTASEPEAVDTILRLAASEIDENELSRWIEANTSKLGS